MILAGPVHQESIVEPLKGRFSYPTADHAADQKSKNKIQNINIIQESSKEIKKRNL